MSRQPLTRRRFLTLSLALLLAPAALRWDRARAAAESRRATYAVDAGILYGMLNYHLDGTLTESVDRVGGRYDVTIVGEGDGIANRIESSGALREGRWAPRESHSFFSVRGRESRSDIAYDWARGTIEYRFRGETFFLRKLRVADDVVAVPEGLDDAQGTYRAELVPLALKMAADPASGKPIALFDLTRFSSWAKRSEPGRITFNRDKRPELVMLDMMLGTKVRVELRSPELRAS